MSFRGRPSIFKVFSYGGENDIFVYDVGYNDFDYIEPMKYPRIQPDYTIHYVMSGSGTLFLCGKRFEVGAGQIFFLPPNREIMYYPSETGEKWKYAWLYFGGELAPMLGSRMGFDIDTPVKTLSHAEAERVEGIFGSILCDICDGTANEFSALAALYAISGALGGADGGAQKRSEIAEQAMKYISVNCANRHFTVESLCSALFTSHSTLCKLFGERYGITPMRALSDMRLNTAKKLLATTKLSIKEISARAGYRDEIHFMKMFKKAFGITATEYRKENYLSSDSVDIDIFDGIDKVRTKQGEAIKK